MLRKLFKNRDGSALLVAMLVMGVLISVSLALASLVFREARVTRDLIDSGKAYYAAESAVELALYKLNTNLDGWEPDIGSDGYKPVKISDAYQAVAEYDVDNRCNAYPCFEQEFDRQSLGKDLYAYYDVLELNESINIPLFVVDEERGEVPVSDFTVEYFTNFDPVKDFAIKESADFRLSSWDILRWKIVGIRGGFSRTISDFTAVSNASVAGSEESFQTNAARPSWFGSVDCDDVDTGLSPRYTDEISCLPYSDRPPEPPKEEKLGDEKASTFVGICERTQAREYYNYGDDAKIDSEDVFGCYEIGAFLENHNLNYLTLTNLMNPAVFRSEYSKEKKNELSKLYYRVEFFRDKADASNETVREVADITANGYSGKAKQSINVKVRRGGFMPVFNFSLYSTHEGDGEG